MRFGKWRVGSLAFAICAVTGLSAVTVKADGWGVRHTIPREVDAYDYTTGGPYYAPPVPYGHYAKDPGAHFAKAAGLGHGLLGKASGLFHKGDGHGHGLGGHGHGDGCGNGGCGLGGGNGCGFCGGKGLFHKGDACGSCGNIGTCGDGGCKSLLGKLGHGKKNFAPCHATTVVASSQQALPAAQSAPLPSGQGLCGNSGCHLAGVHSHVNNLLNKLKCKFCGGGGCGGCKGLGMGDPCGGCGGLGHHGNGLCGKCGGCGLGNLGNKLHGLKGLLGGVLHPAPKVDWFMGAGGPVPLTPGYVPYIVTTRSPRDFFAFPPMNPDVP